MTRPSLAGIEQRISAATTGPWFAVGPSNPGPWNDIAIVPLGEVGAVAYVQPDCDDAAFIAHTRTDLPALTAALREVLRLHTEREHRPLDGTYLGGTVCDHCRHPWPCATVRALAAHLDLTDPEGDPT